MILIMNLEASICVFRVLALGCRVSDFELLCLQGFYYFHGRRVLGF